MFANIAVADVIKASQFAHLMKVKPNFSTPSFVIRHVNLHSQPSLFVSGL